MKLHTNDFKEAIKAPVREMDSIITYILNGETIQLGMDDLNSVNCITNGNILKSTMKQLDIDTNVEIPKGTILNYRFGLKVDDDFEYLNMGNYVVDKIERQEDTQSYKITCYDKMLFTMVEYDEINIEYPTTIRTYLSAICEKLGIIFKNANTEFVNYDKPIPMDLYKGLRYTYRDVLDEIAQATASTICINENDDQLEIRYINNTGDEINEDYLKDINVKFEEKYGPINTIVFSRSADSDKIAQSIPENLPDDEKNSIEIRDNQILNFNNRDIFIGGILNQLYGLEYYLNDFSSFGIGYYNICDKYNIVVGENTYPCILFNDEFMVTQGLEENIYTEMPEETETDYTKTDKTDKRINQTYLIVDKQNQVIEGVVSNVEDQNEQIAEIRLQYNELLSRISDIADITTSGESSYGRVNLTDVNASQPISIKIYPIGENISYLYPYNGLYPSDTLYMKSRTLRFTNTTTSEVFDWVLPTDLWYYDNTTYDELELSYGDGTNSNVIVTRRCQINADGTTSTLATPTTETYAYPSYLMFTDGDYTAELIGYNAGYLYVQLMAKNIYTTQFYTKAETNSVINQKADEINLGVTQTLSNYSTTNQMNSAINLKANEITSTVSETYATKTTTNQLSTRIGQTAKGISLTVNNGSTSSGITIGVTKEDGTTEQTSGTIQMNGLVKFTDLSTSGTTTINGANIQTGTLSASKITSGTLDASKVSVTHLNASNITSGTLSADKISGGTINASDIAVTNITASNINRGSLTGANIDINNGTGFLRMLSGSAYNPYVSALNVSNKSNGISFRNSGSSGNAGSQIGTLHTENNNLVMDATGNILIGGSSMSSGAIGIWSGYLHAGNMALGGNYLNADSGNINLNTESWSAVYANGTMIGGYSSKKAKDNIKKLSADEINELYNEVKELPSCYYDYKEKFGGQTDNYGFVIEDFKENGILRKALHVINYKGVEKYSHDDLTQINTILIKELMKKIETMQKEIDELKKERESDK